MKKGKKLDSSTITSFTKDKFQLNNWSLSPQILKNINDFQNQWMWSPSPKKLKSNLYIILLICITYSFSFL